MPHKAGARLAGKQQRTRMKRRDQLHGKGLSALKGKQGMDDMVVALVESKGDGYNLETEPHALQASTARSTGSEGTCDYSVEKQCAPCAKSSSFFRSAP